MNHLRPLQNDVKPIALSNAQKNALATAMREASEKARQAAALRPELALPAAESRLAESRDVLFIF